jgi:hypothetical protein
MSSSWPARICSSPRCSAGHPGRPLPPGCSCACPDPTGRHTRPLAGVAARHGIHPFQRKEERHVPTRSLRTTMRKLMLAGPRLAYQATLDTLDTPPHLAEFPIDAPWMAPIHYDGGDRSDYFAGVGVVIASDWVLTCAHLFCPHSTDRKPGNLPPPGNIPCPRRRPPPVRQNTARCRRPGRKRLPAHHSHSRDPRRSPQARRRYRSAAAGRADRRRTLAPAGRHDR